MVTKLLASAGLSANILSILTSWINPVIGMVGGLIWLFIMYNKYKQSVADTKLKNMKVDSYQKSHDYHLDNPQDK